MTTRAYVLPEVIVTLNGVPTHLPKYVPHRGLTGPPLEPEPTLAGALRHTVYEGLGDDCLLFLDVTPAQHTVLAAHADVDVIPANLDSTIGAALATTQTRMRARGIPGNWLTAGTTWRELVRGINAMFEIGQELAQDGATRLYPAGVTLQSTIASLPGAYRTALQAAVDRQGYDRSAITGASTMEDLMEVLTTQATPKPMGFAGVI